MWMGEGSFVGGSLPVEASGLSYLRLSVHQPFFSPPRKTSLISLSFLASCNNSRYKDSRQGNLTMLERLSMFKGLVPRIHMFGANRFVVISHYKRFVCVTLSQHAFWLAFFAYTCWETSQYWSLGSVIVQLDAK